MGHKKMIKPITHYKTEETKLLGRRPNHQNTHLSMQNPWALGLFCRFCESVGHVSDRYRPKAHSSNGLLRGNSHRQRQLTDDSEMPQSTAYLKLPVLSLIASIGCHQLPKLPSWGCHGWVSTNDVVTMKTTDQRMQRMADRKTSGTPETRALVLIVHGRSFDVNKCCGSGHDS